MTSDLTPLSDQISKSLGKLAGNSTRFPLGIQTRVIVNEDAVTWRLPRYCHDQGRFLRIPGNVSGRFSVCKLMIR
jgi:hypothetical protein